MDSQQITIAKILVGAGLLLLFAGGIWYFFGDKLQWIGRLPGDIRIEGEHFRFYFPLTTMILASILLTIILRLIRHFMP